MTFHLSFSRPLVDGSHCSRPHPHFAHDIYIAKERQARIEAGYDENRCWDEDYDLQYGDVETNKEKIAVPAQPWTRKRRNHQRLCEEHLDKWFSAKESSLAKVTFQGDRHVVYERYLLDKEGGRAWTPLFINLSGEDFDPEEALNTTLQTSLSKNSSRIFLPGGEFIPDAMDDNVRDPEKGTRPGGFSPQNQAALENAIALQRQEKVNGSVIVCLVRCLYLSNSRPSSAATWHVRWGPPS